MITVELEVTPPDCMITAPDIDFGSSPLVAGFEPVSQVISLTCTKNSSFSIGLNDGLNASGGQRRMISSGHYLEYEIYKSSTMERWGGGTSLNVVNTVTSILAAPFRMVSLHRIIIIARRY